MEIIAVINYKGGVGKTTVSSNLAAELAFRGQKVLLIDTDAQASLTFSFIRPEDWSQRYKETKTIKSWFDAISQGKETASLNDYVITPTVANELLAPNGGRIDLICSHLGLINVDLELAILLGGANMQQSKRNYMKVHGKLRESIAALAQTSDYDIVLIDCPPNFNIVTKNAIIASQKILIPAKPDYLSTLGIDYLYKSVNELVRQFNDYAASDEETKKISPEILGIVFTMIQLTSSQPIAAQRQFISQIKNNGIKTFDNFFRENKTMFSDAPQYLSPVVLNRYATETHLDVVTEIKEFVTEFQRNINTY